MLTVEQSQTIIKCAEALRDAQDNWWIFGGAAIALYGIDAGPIKDIDIVTSLRDAASLAAKWNCPNLADGGTDRFRSTTMIKPTLGAVPVEIMAGFEYRTGQAWLPLAPRTRRAIPIGNELVYVPEPAELIAIFRAFGRPRDLRRAQLMAAAAANS